MCNTIGRFDIQYHMRTNATAKGQEVEQLWRYGLQHLPPLHEAIDYAAYSTSLLLYPARHPVLADRLPRVRKHCVLLLLHRYSGGSV